MKTKFLFLLCFSCTALFSACGETVVQNEAPKNPILLSDTEKKPNTSEEETASEDSDSKNIKKNEEESLEGDVIPEDITKDENIEEGDGNDAPDELLEEEILQDPLLIIGEIEPSDPDDVGVEFFLEEEVNPKK